MLGGEAEATTGAGPREPHALADLCRSVREQLDSIARALGSLREEIDRALVDAPRGEPAQASPKASKDTQDDHSPG